MITTFFAKKVKMSGTYTPEGNYVGATILTVPMMKVKDLRTKEKNQYNAIRLNIQDAKARKEIVREIRTEEVLEPGTEIKFEEMIKPGDRIKVTGISKGKGFAGVVKRHHFKGGPRTHGQSNRERSPGSSGSTTTPGRVFPGTRRAGHMGNEKVSISGLRVLEVDAQNKVLTVVGAVPGIGRGRGNLMTVTKQK
jgi:large subunit ribosomal protein L3